MKKALPLLVLLILTTMSFGQVQGIKITKQNKDKELFIKENKRIKVITKEGEKIKGRFNIGDEKSIIIKGRVINLSDIESVKRNPLLLSIFSSTFFIAFGAINVGFGLLVTAFGGGASGLGFIVPGVALIVTGILSPNLLNKYKVTKGWTFEIVNSSQ